MGKRLCVQVRALYIGGECSLSEAPIRPRGLPVARTRAMDEKDIYTLLIVILLGRR